MLSNSAKQNLKTVIIMTITYERTFQGAWRLSTVHKDRYFVFQYMGFNKKEATQMFREYVRENS